MALQTTNLDNDTDSVKAARPDLSDLMQRVIDIADSSDVAKGAIHLGHKRPDGVSQTVKQALDGDVACVIRQPSAGAGWDFIDDAAHTPINCGGAVTVNGSGNIVVSYSGPYDDVGSVAVTPDETFASLGIVCGASVATSDLTISLYQDCIINVNLATLGVTTNTFYNGTVTAVSNGDGTITITHPAVGSATESPILLQGATGFTSRVVSYTTTSVTIANFCLFSGYVTYDGSIWTVLTSCQNKPTFSFSAGVLTVTHETLPLALAAVAVSSRFSSSVIAFGDAYGTTTFTVGFKDYAGATVTTESTQMRFYYQAMHFVKSDVLAGVVNLRRPYAKLNASNVYSGSGNFWVLGKHF